MRVLVAPDKFTGTLTAREVAAAVCDGLAAAGVQPTALPLADGGDGSVDAALGAGFDAVPVRVRGADGSAVGTSYAYDGRTAVVEVASTCGLATLPPGRLRPMTASSYGFGQAVLAAVDHGARRVVLALGGSASTDGGAGMLAALGVRFLGPDGCDVEPAGATLDAITAVDADDLVDLAGVELVVATDVDNPLLGPHGAAAVFGAQKGATPGDLQRLEDALSTFVRVMSGRTRTPTSTEPRVTADEPGAGAAGGLGYACRWLGASRVSGADYILDLLDFDAHVELNDAVITGEGRLDRQSLAGKLPSVVARRAAGRPIHFVVGSTALDPDEAATLGAASVTALADHTTLDPRQSSELSVELLRELSRDLGCRITDTSRGSRSAVRWQSRAT